VETAVENRKIEIGQDGLKNLNASRKWAMFLSVLGFIFFGLLVVMGVIAGLFLTTFKEGSQDPGTTEFIILIVYIILAAFSFMPVFFLFRFSKHIAKAVNSLDNNELNKAIRNLKSYFFYFGVLIIIILAVYFAVLIGTGTSISLIKGLG
jgi:hypothetical protein